MSEDKPSRLKVLMRRAFLLIVALLPFAVCMSSIGYGVARQKEANISSIGFIIAAVSIAAMNFYLSFIRPFLFYRKNGAMDGYRHNSGFPGIGTILVLLSLYDGFGSIGIAVMALITTAIDTGGISWFVICVWRDQSFWNAPR